MNHKLIGLSALFLLIVLTSLVNADIIDAEKNLKTTNLAGIFVITDNVITCNWTDPNSNWRQCEAVFEINNTNAVDVAFRNAGGALQNLNISMLNAGKNIQYYFSATSTPTKISVVNQTCYSKLNMIDSPTWVAWNEGKLCRYTYTRNIYSNWQPIASFTKLQNRTSVGIKVVFDSPITSTSKEYTTNQFNFTLKNAVMDLVLDPDISICSTLPTLGAVYTLTADITNNASAICMDITGGNVTLDCAGHTIDGVDGGGTYGISVSRGSIAVSNATIKNCVITDWERGISLTKANGNTIYNNSMYSNTAGLYPDSSSLNIIYNNSASSGGTGGYAFVPVTYSNNNTFYNNTAYGTAYGFHIYGASNNNTLYNNIVQNNTVGINLDTNPSNNSIYNNLLNQTTNFRFAGTVLLNFWNTTNQSGTRIYSAGTNIGGNYYTNAAGNGQSDTCADTNNDGFCDATYTLSGANNIDYLPLSDNYYSAAPTYSENTTNSTLAGTNVQHDLRWANGSATTNVSGYIFGFCNGSYATTAVSQVNALYNFTVNTTNKAWWASPANPITVPSGGTEATAAQYTNMTTENAQYANVCSDATNGDPYWSMNFTINEATANINWINITIKGYFTLVSGTEVATCYAYNYTAPGWTTIGAMTKNSNTEFSKNFTSRFSDIIDTNQKLSIYCTGLSFDAGECMWHDFVGIDVNYNASVPASAPCSDAGAVLTNDTWVAFTNAMCQTPKTDCWSNVTKLVNSTVGSTIKWCISANDTLNIWNYTSCNTPLPFSYLTSAAGGAVAYYHSGDIGDPLYCSIPSLTGATNTEILCMPKSNITGQPITGLTVVCQANAQGLYTAGVQAASTCGERSYGVYNWTFLGSSMTAGSSYTINCSTAIETTVNGFAASIYIMPSFALQSTLIAVGANTSFLQSEILQVGSNLTNHNTTMNTEYGLLAQNLTLIQGNLTALDIGKIAQNLTLIQGNLSAMITSASSAYTNLTAVNNSLGTFMTASYSDFANNTAMNYSMAALMTAMYSQMANLTALRTASFSNFANNTAMNNSLQALMTASYSNFLNNTAMNNSMTAYYNALANNLTNHNTTMVAEFNAIGTNLTNMNTTIVATNNSLAAFYGNLASNLTTLQFEILQVGSNITSVNTTMNAKFLEVVEDLFYIQGNVTAINNSLQNLMTASWSNFANTTAINNSLGTFITASYSNFLNLTSHNATMTAQYGKISENLTLILGNLSALDIGKLAQNLTNINSTLVATNNSLQVLMTASSSNFLNNTAMNNSLATFYGKLSENLTLVLGNMSALDMGALSTNITSVNNTVIAVGSNLTNVHDDLVATNNSLSTLMTASYSNFANVTALNYSLTSYYNAIGTNLTNMNVSIIATNNSLATFYGKLAENNTLILGNLTALDIGKLAQNLTNINMTLVATNNSLQVLMTASASNFMNTTAMNNSMSSFYGKTSQNLTLILGNLSALNIDAIAQNLTDINMTLIATNNSIYSFYNNLAANMTSVNDTVIAVGNNVTSVNNTIIAVGSNLTTYYWALAANMTAFNTSSMAILAQIGINITSVNNTVIIVGSNLTNNMTRVFNILSAIAGCIPCPIGGLSGGRGSTTIPIPALFSGPANYTAILPQAPITNTLVGVVGFLFVICGGMYYQLNKSKKKLKKAKGIIAAKDEEEEKKKKTAKPR